MKCFDHHGNPTREFLDSDAYYDDPALRAEQRVEDVDDELDVELGGRARARRRPCGPCRGCGRTNEKFTIWAEQDLCTGCARASAIDAPTASAAKEAA